MSATLRIEILQIGAMLEVICVHFAIFSCCIRLNIIGKFSYFQIVTLLRKKGLYYVI